MFCKKLFLEIFQNSQENTCARVSFLIKLQTYPLRHGLVCNFIKKETLAQVFSCEFCKISKYTYFHRTPLVAASELIRYVSKITETDFPQIKDYWMCIKDWWRCFKLDFYCVTKSKRVFWNILGFDLTDLMTIYLVYFLKFWSIITWTSF